MKNTIKDVSKIYYGTLERDDVHHELVGSHLGKAGRIVVF